MDDSLNQFSRILRIIQGFIHNDSIDREGLAVDLFLLDPLMPRIIIINKCRDAGRLLAREYKLKEDLKNGARSSHLQDYSILNRIISHANCSPEDRHLLYLKYWKGLSHEFIALELSLSKFEVSKRIHSLIERLKLSAHSLIELDSQTKEIDHVSR